MPGMRDIKRRIKSIQNTQQITKAMKTVAAAKLRKTQAKVVAARPYAGKLGQVLGRLAADLEGFQHPFLEEREGGTAAYVVVTGDRGLAGGYNVNVMRLAEETIQGKKEEKAAIIAVGRKARDYFRRRKYPLLREYLEIGDEPHYIQARELARELTELYLQGEADKIYLVYSRFYSAIRYVPRVEQLLPIEVLPPKGEEEDLEEYLYEPGKEEVLKTLLPRYLETLTYRALLEAKTSEHGARMTAMDAATDNAAEMIDKLTLSFNRARQAAITREISEIVGGAAALS
ncbi:MAG: F0F1 ATP synthase subunit gamma [Clostridia bacterium]|jgi:F-type H+-transporting ATPase subunit gamma|nr:F0F1 ATP synthase subunit gamma [Clostridia bacterium]